jgi:hypothetical protein
MTAMLTAEPILQVAPVPAVTDAPALDFGARYTVDGHRGIAFYLTGYATEWTEESWEVACDNPAHVWNLCDESDDECHDPWCYLYNEPEEVERTDMVRAVMVGDDREHIVDVDDLTEISEEDYCPGCGQVGCKAYG